MSLKARDEFVVKERTNSRTGEIITEIERTTKAVGDLQEEPNYVKLYLKAWCDFKQIKKVNNALLYELLQYMSYADKGQEIILNATIKQRISKKLGWSMKSYQKRFNTELSMFIKGGILKRTGVGVYAVNPQLIGKGNWAQVKNFRAVFNLLGENAGAVEPIMG